MTLLGRPYEQFNFLVNFGVGARDGFDAGFQECSTVSTELRGAEYEIESARLDQVEISSCNKPPAEVAPSNSLTLKRGVVNSTALHTLLDDLKQNSKSPRRTIIIQLQNEDRTGPVQVWKLHNAGITKVVSDPLNAKGNDVAMEEMTLAYERLELK